MAIVRPLIGLNQQIKSTAWEIWLSGIVGGLVETCCNGLITICHEVGNDGYSGSYWPKTGVRHISISTVSGGTLLMVTTVANVNKGQAKRTQRTM
jgi:hypothetical protein